MSWSTYTCGLPADINGRIDALEPPGTGTPEREDQLKAAKAAAKAIIAAGAIGSGDAFMVTLSGHANPEHKPTSGWANDATSVSLAQVAATQVEQFDAAQAQALANEQ